MPQTLKSTRQRTSSGPLCRIRPHLPRRELHLIRTELSRGGRCATDIAQNTYANSAASLLLRRSPHRRTIG
ncbi:hypothetical protein F2P81_005866 [Scophthalmus maximus]|uniref:Uncharacterized protein n=1 Tax=Scophthalmus maximus TaxID=52904 RepID=A0A6A4TGI3_SCOMX|nr:hypothetical protein F2P81_005866 [Scophthalmus maximus]